MDDITITNGVSQQIGIPGNDSFNINVPVQILTGSQPPVLTDDVVVGTGLSISALTPIVIVAATETASATIKVAPQGTPADGITIFAIDTTTLSAATKARIYRGGCFNPGALNWDASFTTDEQKRLAFEGSKNPTRIVLRAVEPFSPPQPN